MRTKSKQSWGLSMRILPSNKTCAGLAGVSVALLGLPGAAFAGVAGAFLVQSQELVCCLCSRLRVAHSGLCAGSAAVASSEA